MKNTTKFGSPKMDIYNSTYDFSNFVQKFVKEITETLNRSRWQRGPTGQGTPPVSEPKQSTVVGRLYLDDGEHSGKTDHTVVTYSLNRIDWYR